MKYNSNDIIGEKFGRLIVTGPEERLRDNNGHVNRYIFCDCDCGNRRVLTNLNELLNGEVKSCGCLGKENLSKLGEGRRNGTIKSSGHTTHGDSAKDSPYRLLHDKWERMKHKVIIGKYKMCPEWNNWLTFKQWALDNGWTAEVNPKLKLQDDYYSPNTCRFE